MDQAILHMVISFCNPLFWPVSLRADILAHKEITRGTTVSYNSLSQHTLKKLHLLIKLMVLALC